MKNPISPATPAPTPAELEVLRILWKAGPSTVRDVHDRLQKERSVGYTTALKTLQIMTDKGLVTREELGKAHIYRAAHTQERTSAKLVRDLVDRLFDGAAQKLVLHALSTQPATEAELAEIRTLLDRLGEQKP